MMREGFTIYAGYSQDCCISRVRYQPLEQDWEESL